MSASTPYQQTPLAAIFSLEGLTPSDDERTCFEQANPLGFILFKRNIESPEQLLSLTTRLKEIVGWDCPILIDQEGGRVQRMKEPHWPPYPAPLSFDGDAAAVKASTMAMVSDLVNVGINVNCAPTLDVLTDKTDNSIGDRAFGHDVQTVTVCGKAVIDAHLAQGVVPIIKHLPGQGRVVVDSHHDLPHVPETNATLSHHDFQPFQELSASYGSNIWGMVAHILFTELDKTYPSTLSKHIIHDIIRHEIGCQGLLLSDDISMGALEKYGDESQRGALSLKAGMDIVLYCAGKLEHMYKLQESLPLMTDAAQERFTASWDRGGLIT